MIYIVDNIDITTKIMSLTTEKYNITNAQPFDSLGLFTFLRTYARRHKDDDPNSSVETWEECITRVVNSCNTQLNCNFTDEERQEFFDLLYNLKCSVAGRFLWQLGTRTVDKLGLMSLQNCAFTVIDEPVKPFTWIMNFLMLGAGCGYRISKEDVEKLPMVHGVEIIRRDVKDSDFIVPDTRQGWVKLLGKVLKAHFYSGKGFTYSCHLLRSKGAPIKGFGGLASGPDELCKGIEQISVILNKKAGQKVNTVDCLDIANIIGRIVVSGNVRRCLPIGSSVQTNKGLVNIENINVGDMVATMKGYRKVRNFFYQGVQDLLEIKLMSGKSFVCTPNHKIAVYENSNFNTYVWKMAKDINTNTDFMIKYKEVPMDKKTKNIYYNNENVENYKFPYFVEIDKVKEINFNQGNNYTYDLEIEEEHEFFSQGYLCHNSAQIALGDASDGDFMKAKRWDLGNIPNWRCYSNNSVICNDINEILDNEDFWSGYQGNGEPYGLINLNLCRKTGRIGDLQYPDKSVEGVNPCVSGDTIVFTEEGPKRVLDIIGKKIKVYVDGQLHSTTDRGFFKTGNKQLYKLKTNRGYSVRITGNHEILTKNGEWTPVEKLKIGDEIRIHNHNNQKISWKGDGTFEEGYLLGVFVGDGSFMRSENPSATICMWKSKGFEDPTKCTSYKFIEDTMMNMTENSLFIGWNPVKRNGKEVVEYRISNNKLTQLANKFGLYRGNKTITEKIEMSSSEFHRGFLSGLFDTDGSVMGSSSRNGVSVRLNQSDLIFLEKAQRMLLRLGMDSSIYKRHDVSQSMMPDGKGGEKLYTRKENYELVLSKFNLDIFESRVGFMRDYKREKLQNLRSQYVHKLRKQNFSSKIQSIELDNIEEVYDCTVPGVRAFDAQGIYVSNCSEQTLSRYETCCLADIFLPRVESYEQLLKSMKYLYRACKHSLALPCADSSETENIVHNNFRMGIGVTGYLQATDEQRAWLKPAYEELRKFDEEYSKINNFPPSVKLCTTKPSGTLSLLGHCTPGVHPAFSQYMIRRIRVSSESKLVKLAEDHGYRTEYVKNFDGTLDYTTKVIEFPYSYPEGTILAENCTAIDQMEWVKKMQTDYSDNAVSVTVYYKKEELPEIKEWLKKNYNDNVKAISFLLHSEHGFIQAPLEKITKEQYDELIKNTRPITDVSTICYNSKVDENFIGEGECAGGACPLK